jgi:hypothetical protein
MLAYPSLWWLWTCALIALAPFLRVHLCLDTANIQINKSNQLPLQGQRGRGLLCGMCSPKHIILKLYVEILVSKS